MNSNSKRKRAKRVKRQLLLQREEKMKQRKEERVKEKEEALKTRQLNRYTGATFRHKESDMTPEQIKEQLDKNMKVLEELQNEYEKTLKNRKDLNDKLEEKGAKTMQEKMNLLNELAQKMQQNEESKVGSLKSHCEVSFTPNP